MIESATSRDRRAQIAALVGFATQACLFAVVLIVGIYWESAAIQAVSRWFAGGMVIWLVLAVVYRQRRRMTDEKLEAEELLRSRDAGGTGVIFDTEGEAYLIERRRLNWVLRWLVPGAALVLALYHLAGTFIGWGWSLGTPVADESWTATPDRGPALAFLAGVGFLAFLFSRYTAGMARVRGWRMMRAGASYLAGNALACLVALIAIALQGTEIPHAEPIAAYAIRIAMLVVGFEFVANYILDLYRPRLAGQETRPAFDSRLLALVSEPTGIARSIADAINYQFGFEVSATWFYQLLKRAMLPMIAFGLFVLFALSSVLIVDADEQVFVERFGLRRQATDVPLGPGFYFKAPWPIDMVYRARVDQVRSLTIGTEATEDEVEVHGGVEHHKPILWGEKHDFNTEMMLVVASPELTDLSVAGQEADAGKHRAKSVAVGLLMVSVDIQYCVKSLDGYLYRYADPEAVVEAIAYQVLSDYAASVDVNRFMGAGRQEIDRELSELLSKRLDDQGLGIEILFVGLQDAHPTDAVAKEFQQVVSAERKKRDTIERARGMAERTLAMAAGSWARAMLLNDAIVEMDRLDAELDTPSDDQRAARDRVEALLMGDPVQRITPTSGRAAKLIAEARADARSAVSEAESKRRLFVAELIAYQAAPELYRTRKYLQMLQRSLTNVRKYVLAVDPAMRVVIEYEQGEGGTIEIGEPPK